MLRTIRTHLLDSVHQCDPLGCNLVNPGEEILSDDVPLVNCDSCGKSIAVSRNGERVDVRKAYHITLRGSFNVKRSGGIIGIHCVNCRIKPHVKPSVVIGLDYQHQKGV